MENTKKSAKKNNILRLFGEGSKEKIKQMRKQKKPKQQNSQKKQKNQKKPKL